MYKILGDDGQEYGPVPIAQVKKWIKENRLEKTTPVFPKGAADWVFIGSLPEFAAAFEPGARDKPEKNPAASSQNPKARTAFYFGIFSVIPILGAPLGLIGLVLGLRGLVFYWKNPAAGGKVQAWAGISLGGIFGLGYSALIVLVVLAAMAHKHATH